MEFKESLGGDLWIQNLTLTNGVVNEALQEIQDQIYDQSPQMLLARCSLAKPSLAKPSLVKLSIAELNLTESQGIKWYD